MDSDTLIKSIRYRCWQRGEDYEYFIQNYVTRAELAAAMASTSGCERAMGVAMWNVAAALDVLYAVCEQVQVETRED